MFVLWCDYYSQGDLVNIDQFDDRKILNNTF